MTLGLQSISISRTEGSSVVRTARRAQLKQRRSERAAEHGAAADAVGRTAVADELER